ncbi:restriction endonuclease subunit S [Leeuwenhoekiella sp. ZYFB001]|uniref:restriction endonuclease subunit S n=1 Tax=Leeuwenhoekiella sp. ZYFB001 TaxID=2719912 RepID=UPI00143223D9|nr:restriction endonuclease subunit S [Leeuwenhoekiella sp. ZYFB001]
MASRGDIDYNSVQPNLLPNWKTIDFENSLDKTPKYVKHKTKGLSNNGTYPVIDQGDSFIGGYIDDPDKIYTGEYPIIVFGDHTRVVKFIDFEFAVGADGTKILRPKSQLKPKFFFYYLKTLKIPDLGYSRHFKILKEIQVPLPPRAEQDRIVAKLDTLFEQLEHINKSLDHIPTLLKNFRQQVLTQAVTGKLTEEWRKGKELQSPNEIISEIYNNRAENLKGNKLTKLQEIYSDSDSSLDFPIPSNWIEINLDKICTSFSYGTSSKSNNEGTYPVLRMGNIQQGKLDWSDLKYTSDSDEYEKYKLNKGDVLFNRTNSPELVGKTSIYRGEIPALYAGYLIKIDSMKELNSEFLNIVLNTNYAKKWCWEVKTDGVSQSNINATKLSKFTLPFPSPDEQQEIVNRVENLFAKVDAIEVHYEALKTKIEHLPQAILHKAFKGELVPQLESDGDARELLREIEGVKKGISGTKKKTATKK